MGTLIYAAYRNGFLRARVNSADSVVVTWGVSRFSHSVTLKTWESGEFLGHPTSRRTLDGDERDQAVAFFER